MSTEYYKDYDGGFHAVTGECPPGFANVLYVGWGGPTPKQVEERLYTPVEIGKMEPADPPLAWWDALGIEEPEPAPKPEPETVEVDITWPRWREPEVRPWDIDRLFWYCVGMLAMLAFILWRNL